MWTRLASRACPPLCLWLIPLGWFLASSAQAEPPEPSSPPTDPPAARSPESDKTEAQPHETPPRPGNRPTIDPNFQNPPEAMKPEAEPQAGEKPAEPQAQPERPQIRLKDYHASPDDIKPLPQVPIPDDPPPHEGAPFVLPYVIQAPDVIHVSILQAAPGRPLDGDRLIRPDGKISLDFYGDLSVEGLSTVQVKEKVVLLLRKHLDDTTLGLVKFDEETGEPVRDADGKYVGIPPAETDAVYVDVSQYNSGIYYVQGDIGLPGRYPITGHEFVLDALNYAGGLLATAEENDVHLARPARAGKPARIYKVDMAAIRERADSTTNFQLFPGDRLIVGRNAVAKASVQLNRLSEPLMIVNNAIYSFTLTMRTINQATIPPMSPSQREAVLKRWADFLRNEANRPGGPVLDDRLWREWLDRFDIPAPAPGEAPTPPPAAPN